MAWWRDAKFGMFIHWGLYSVPAGSYHGAPEKGSNGEWIMNVCKIPVSEYAGYATEFNPTHFDADKWVRLAKDAGMKYMVITAKHHDGFAMFDSKVGGYNIVDNTPFKRDPLKELTEACGKQGMKLGFYYSQNQDWHAPGGSTAGGHWDPAQQGSFDKYLQTVAVPQVKELLSNYGPDFPAILWWDTPMSEMTPPRAALFQPLLARRPDLITNNRLSSGAAPGLGYPGDTETPEQHIPPSGFPNRDWETCMTINNTWGYKANDTSWKSEETLLHNLIDIVSKGGNYLLNVGPDSTGTIPQPEAERLLAIGKWLKTNGDAIYGTKGSPFKNQFGWGRVTQKDHRLFLHVFGWPHDQRLVVPIHNQPAKAFLLAAPDQLLSTSTSEEGLTISLPATAPDPIATVVELDLTDALDLLPPGSLAQKPDGSLKLEADTATLKSEDNAEPTARLEAVGGQPNIGYWVKSGDFATWTARIKKPGTFDVSAEYAAAPHPLGVGLILSAGENSVHAVIPATGAWNIFHTASLGTIEIANPGSVIVALKRDGDKSGGCNLRSLQFVPHESP